MCYNHINFDLLNHSKFFTINDKDPGIVTILFDGSYNSNADKSTIGIVCQNYEGFCLLQKAIRIEVALPLQSETLACLHAVLIAMIKATIECY